MRARWLFSRAASTRRCARCVRSGATRSSSSAARARRSSTSTATATSTTSARGARWSPATRSPDVLAAIARAAADGTSFGAPTEGEVELAEEVARRMARREMLRMTSSGTEAAMTAIRVARAAHRPRARRQVRRRLPRALRRPARRRPGRGSRRRGSPPAPASRPRTAAATVVRAVERPGGAPLAARTRGSRRRSSPSRCRRTWGSCRPRRASSSSLAPARPSAARC